jgi:hypothetical protein
MAWDYVDDEATLKSMADCGINAVAFVPVNMLDACQKYGIKAIVNDEEVMPGGPFNGDRACKVLPGLIKKVNDHPAVYGYHLKDEPHAEEYPELAKAIEMVKQLAPGKWPYVNLFPGGGEKYDAYLRDFVEICEPTVMSFDYYPTLDTGEFREGFWTIMAHVRQYAKLAKVDLQTIVLTVAHWGYREVTAADIRLQVFGSLVYGARGISFYKFISKELPIHGAPDLGNWRMAPLNQWGEKTRTWDDLHDVNRMVLNLAPTLLKLRSDDVYHIGGEIPNRNHGPNEETLVKSLPDATQWIVGDFTHEDGSRWVMIVNKDLERSFTCKAEFNVPVKKLEYLCPITGKLRPYDFPHYFFLAPGAGVLLKLEQ